MIFPSKSSACHGTNTLKRNNKFTVMLWIRNWINNLAIIEFLLCIIVAIADKVRKKSVKEVRCYRQFA